MSQLLVDNVTDNLVDTTSIMRVPEHFEGQENS
ncbi:hypothetical protein PF005_g14951 [Phytophthora fragariae]|uniref:Uncharacterized protein n=1 Tax=Phytophthora fragariae TaxID=53985 RepID=A0A6A3XEY9_9STRA|nr:hypothetical protein PF005_g14951 [Phytophthora fragariae]